ncbi:MAG TPA: hypothetical protein V6C72_01225 [Chroococcales cyanobacterium]
MPALQPSYREFLRRWLALPLAGVALLISFPLNAFAFPPFQEFSEKHSGRTVNCSMCHLNDNGPVGSGPNQIDSLSAADLERLNLARAQMEPGGKVDNPILNKFGNQIVYELGINGVAKAVADPGSLASALSSSSDLDGDGIADRDEFLDGTDPLNRDHGQPLKLFWINLERQKMTILVLLAALTLIVFGLRQFLPARRS